MTKNTWRLALAAGTAALILAGCSEGEPTSRPSETISIPKPGNETTTQRIQTPIDAVTPQTGSTWSVIESGDRNKKESWDADKLALVVIFQSPSRVTLGTNSSAPRADIRDLKGDVTQGVFTSETINFIPQEGTSEERKSLDATLFKIFSTGQQFRIERDYQNHFMTISGEDGSYLKFEETKAVI